MTRQDVARHAYDTVRRLERDVFQMVRATMTQPWRYARAVVQADDAVSTQEQFDAALRHVLSPREFAIVARLQQASSTTYAEDLVQFARWQRNRTIYTVHPDTLTALRNTDWGKTRIPGEVLRRLPHPDVMVVLPEPIRWRNDEGDWESYDAFGVFGVRPPRRRASSHDDDITHLALHYFGRVTDESGAAIRFDIPDLNSAGTTRRVTQVLGCRAVVDVTRDGTMAERQREAVEDMFAGGPSATVGFGSVEEAAAGMSVLTETGLAILTYLASDNLDLDRAGRVGERTRKKQRRGAAVDDGGEDATVWRVGYRIGAALGPHAVTATRTPGSGDGTRSVTPHLRRAHLHTFRRGPQHSERFVKWLPPIAVKAEGKSRRVTTATVHEIR